MSSWGLRAVGLGVVVGAAPACSEASPPPAVDVADASSACRRDGDVFRLREFRVAFGSTTASPSLPPILITHVEEPDRPLLSTTSSVPFISGGHATFTAPETRGSFTVTETIADLCAAPSLASVQCEGEQLTIRGNVAGNEACAREFWLTFTPQSSERLGFELNFVRNDYIELRYDSNNDEGFYGFGEQFTYADLKGQVVPILVQEQGIGRGDPVVTPFIATVTPGSQGTPLTTYVSVPQYITTDRREVFLENSEYSVFDLTDPASVKIRLFAPRARGQIVHGKSPLELLERYTEYSGRMKELPAWIHEGAIVGMQGGTAAVRAVRDKLKAAGTPVSAYWLQDWVGKRTTSLGSQLWWNWELDTDRYPNWSELVQDLKADNARVFGYASPYLVDVSNKGNARRNLYLEAQAAGYLVKDANGEPYHVGNSDFTAGMVDLTLPAARDWMKTILRGMIEDVGFSGWMADYAEALPFVNTLGSGDPATKMHNLYPVLWGETNRDAVAESSTPNDVVFFTRAGHAKSPGTVPLMWLGDQTVSWDEFDGLQSAVTGMMGGGVSGFALNHSDIGGYLTLGVINLTRPKELLLRWMEMAAFTTVFRTHEGNQPEVNAQAYTDDETIAAFTRFAKVYRALAPYRKTLVREAAQYGLPVVRHPWLHYPNDIALRRLQKENQEFMLGPDVIVAPVLASGATSRTVYLPAGEWVHLFRGNVLGDPNQGATFTVDAPLGAPPAFVKKGSASEMPLREALHEFATP